MASLVVVVTMSGERANKLHKSLLLLQLLLTSLLSFKKYMPYLLDQTPLSISRRSPSGRAERNGRHSRIVATPPDILNEIVATLEY